MEIFLNVIFCNVKIILKVANHNIFGLNFKVLLLMWLEFRWAHEFLVLRYLEKYAAPFLFVQKFVKEIPTLQVFCLQKTCQNIFLFLWNPEEVPKKSKIEFVNFFFFFSRPIQKFVHILFFLKFILIWIFFWNSL